MQRRRTQPAPRPYVASLKRPSVRAGLPPWLPFLLLAAARLVSAALNIVHDCDEVYNYWEPLHFIMYGHGMQTWEYSAQYALRCWLYLLLHAAIGAPAAAVFGAGRGKVVVFYLIKAALGLTSALSEWALYRAVQRRYSATVANSFLVLLTVSSGMFVASTGLLPSSFTMYALTAAAAGVLEGKARAVIATAAAAVVWGWCVAGPAFLPYAAWVLVAAPLLPSIAVLATSLLAVLTPLVLVDRAFYGKWTASLFNFLRYNVAGGGHSALYGVEGPSYYLRNGANQLQLVLPLALILPLLAAAAWAAGTAFAAKRSTPKSRGGQGIDGTLLLCVSPVFVWLAAITALPHKEERFLYVAYPLACLAAATSLDLLAGLTRASFRGATGIRLARLGVASALALTAVLSLSRSAALVSNYGAPMRVYRALPPSATPRGNSTTVAVCLGAEWHRFPSAFFLPGPLYRLHFIKSGFNGLLPRPFDPEHGGAAAAPRQLNDQNREEPANYWASAQACDFAVTMIERGGGGGWGLLDGGVLGSLEEWDVVAEAPFVDNAASPALTRALYVPGLSAARNRWVRYAVLARRREV